MKNLSVLFCLFLFLISCTSNQKVDNDSAKQSNTLVFLSNRGNGFDLYKTTLGDSLDSRITSNPGWDWNAQVIHGSQIVYNSTDTAGSFNMRKMDAEGNSLPFQLQGLPAVTIAPDGNAVIYARKKNDSSYLMLSHLDHLVDSLSFASQGTYNGRAKWSMDSEKIAYISDRTGSNEIYIYSLVDHTTVQVTSNQMREKYLAWAPSGNQLATTMQTDSTENDIYLITLSDNSISRLSDTPTIHESEITWSPDGAIIAYHAMVEGQDDLFALEIASNIVSKITDGEGYHGEPVFLLP